MVEDTPPGDALPPPPQRATPARKGARCGAGAGSPCPHRPHPGHTGRGTLAARSRGRTAGGGTAPDTRCPSQRWQATLPGEGPPPSPQHAAPTGHAGQGESVGPPHPHARVHGTWVVDPNSPPMGGQSGEGQHLTSDAPHNVEGTPPGDALPPPPQRAMPARKGARCGAGAGSPRPHRPHPEHTGRGTLAAHSRGRAARGGTAPVTRRPSQQWQATPPEDGPPTTPAARSPHGACKSRGQCWAPTPTHPRSQQVGGGPETARAVGGQSGAGQRLTSDAPHNGGRHPPQGRPSATPTASNAAPQGRRLWGRCWVPTPAPTSPGTHGSWNPGCPLKRTGGRGRESACHQTPHTTVEGHPPRGRPSATPAARSPHRAWRPRGQCWAPTPTHPLPQHVNGGPQQPAQWPGSRGRDSA